MKGRLSTYLDGFFLKICIISNTKKYSLDILNIVSQSGKRLYKRFCEVMKGDESLMEKMKG